MNINLLDDIKKFTEECLTNEKKSNITFIDNFLSNYITKYFNNAQLYSENIYNFYDSFPDILTILFNCSKNKIESMNDFKKLYNLFTNHILRIIFTFQINNKLFFQLDNKNFEIFEYFYERLLYEIINYEGNPKKFIIVSKKENINIPSFNLERSFSFNLFKCLFDAILEEVVSNIIIDKYNYCIKSILIKINEGKNNLLLLSCISSFFDKIHQFYLEKRNENGNLNTLYSSLIKGIFYYFKKILNDKTQNLISISDFGNIFLSYLDIRQLFFNRHLENLIIINLPFYTIIFKDFLFFFILSDKINEEDWITFTKVVKFIIINHNKIKKFLNEDKRKYLEEIENFYQLNFPKDIFTITKKEKEIIIDIIYSINNKINGTIDDDNFKQTLEETKDNLLNYFSLTEKSIKKMKKFSLENINTRNIKINNIINPKKVKIETPWIFEIDNENESLILFYIFRFISLIIDYCRNIPINDYRYPKTNLRPFCNIFFLIRNILLISSMIFLIYIIYLNSPRFLPIVE